MGQKPESRQPTQPRQKKERRGFRPPLVLSGLGAAIFSAAALFLAGMPEEKRLVPAAEYGIYSLAGAFLALAVWAVVLAVRRDHPAGAVAAAVRRSPLLTRLWEDSWFRLLLSGYGSLAASVVLALSKMAAGWWFSSRWFAVLAGYYLVLCLTKGLVLVTQEHTCQEIGDEPFQMRQKFPDILIALDGNRCRAIEHLLSLPKEQRPEVILLDDAFQHRYVAASFTILLTDYGCMFYQDHLLPIGRLREPANGKQRADLIIVSKTPIDLKPIEYRITETNMHLKAHQAVFFTYIQYGSLQPIFPNALPIVHPFPQEYSILLVTGIASPRPLIEEVKKWGNELRILSFPDHHDFKESDIKKMHARFQAISNKQKIILTTEKDASRLSQNPYITEDMKQYLFYIPICIGFQNEQDKEFEQTSSHKFSLL